MILIAYIDATLGSMVLQAFAGTVFAGLVMGRRYLMAPFTWLGSRRSGQERDGETNELEEQSAVQKSSPDDLDTESILTAIRTNEVLRQANSTHCLY